MDFKELGRILTWRIFKTILGSSRGFWVREDFDGILRSSGEFWIMEDFKMFFEELGKILNYVGFSKGMLRGPVEFWVKGNF